MFLRNSRILPYKPFLRFLRLSETGRIPEAIHEARICLRLNPQSQSANNLIADLCVLPVAIGEEKSNMP